MAIRIFPKQKQGKGAFNGGDIVENKPIVPGNVPGSMRPYSNLFYWAHARAVTDSTIGLHPHEGFEICSFILKGEIRHYDTKLREWRPLRAGGAQIIRAGNGISHSEWMGKDAEMFQIWFDPNLRVALTQPASYDDYEVTAFPETTANGVVERTIVGEGSPFRMETSGIGVQRLELGAACKTLSLGENRMASIYTIEGEALVGGERLGEGDFAVVDDVASVELESLAGAALFVITSPKVPPYRTYAQQQ
jgi:quercetin 2,3-dioxygenase